MADLALVTANRVSVVGIPIDQYAGLAGVDIDAGEPVYFNTTTGKLALADASGASTADVLGLALNTVKAGEPVTIMVDAILDGFDLSGMDFGEPVYLSNTEGKLADATGTVVVRVGEVISAHANSISNYPDRLLKLHRSVTPA